MDNMLSLDKASRERAEKKSFSWCRLLHWLFKEEG